MEVLMGDSLWNSPVANRGKTSISGREVHHRFRHIELGKSNSNGGIQLGLSENSVANDPMVNDHYPY